MVFLLTSILHEFIFSKFILSPGLQCLGAALADTVMLCNTLYDNAVRKGIVANVEKYCELDSDFRDLCTSCCNKQENGTTGAQATFKGD